MSGLCCDRDWVLATLAHKPMAAVPFNFTFCPPAAAALQKHFGNDDIPQALGLPIRASGCRSIKPLYASPAKYGPTIADEFGVVWSTSDVDRSSPLDPPLREASLAGYRFPNAADEHRFECLGPWCQANQGHFRMLWAGDLWERATFMRGMENLLLDVVAEPKFVGELLRKLADHILATMQILFDRFEFDAIAISDDYGTQRSMIISPLSWRHLLRPLLEEIFAMAHRHGRYTFLHSCGHIEPIVPDLIEIGLDILHPIQPEAMDILRLKRDFGRDLTFCGGLRTQDLLPMGTPQQVRHEVRRLKEIMGRDGGYILEPGITVQGDVPLANMLAMIEEARSP